ncbi:BTB/POZ domain-containing protein At3g05675 [Aristolochia californica]|uniref:BTB/POZ domain-containing protein At3g05675 n=1 Tax=Aristolochia californica TaxID=171875 RepID=UPI0035D89597
METSSSKDLTRPPSQIGDLSTSDVVVRIRTAEGRDDRFYCHSYILSKSKYFAERLSENWPTCQILDSRNCIELHCEEPDFNHHVNALRLLYVPENSLPDNYFGVRNALGILRVAINLGCHPMVQACVDYLEALPWEEAEEEEILRIIPSLGSQVERILARLRPVDPVAVARIFISAVHIATSSPPPSMHDLKVSAQEQLEYMLTEDDDDPLLASDNGVKPEVLKCVMTLLSRFYSKLEFYTEDLEDWVGNAEEQHYLLCLLPDLAWACQILGKLEMMKEFVLSWVDSSYKIVKGVERASSAYYGQDLLALKLKVIEIVAKVLEAIGDGNVILPTEKRLQVVKSWLPFVRKTKPLLHSVCSKDEDSSSIKIDDEVWQIVESSFVSIVLTLPSGTQGEILAEWLSCQQVQYPDLTEAFEVWCNRSKVAKRRLSSLEGKADIRS